MSTVWKMAATRTFAGSRPASAAPARMASTEVLRFPGCVPTRMKTPSATPPAMRSVRGPPAAIQIGTGRWWGRRAGSRAPTSTASPSSSRRISRVLASSSRTRAGRSPIRRTAASPTPQATAAAGAADDHAVAPREVDDALHALGRDRFFGRAVAHQLDTGQEALATHVANPGMSHERAEPVQEIGAVLGGALGQALLEEDLDGSVCHGGRDAITAIRRDLEDLPALRRLAAERL